MSTLNFPYMLAKQALMVAVVASVSALGGLSDAGASSRPLTLGVGGGVGFVHTTQPGQAPTSTFTQRVDVRIKALWVLGLDWSVGFDEGPPEMSKPAALQFHANTRLTGLLYVLPTSVASVYVAGGIGGADVSELLSVTAPGNAYHGGFGFEWHLSEHITVDTSFLVLVPGVHSIEQNLSHRVAQDDEISLVQGGASGGPSIRDYVDPNNFEFMVRLYFFI